MPGKTANKFSRRRGSCVLGLEVVAQVLGELGETNRVFFVDVVFSSVWFPHKVCI